MQMPMFRIISILIFTQIFVSCTQNETSGNIEVIAHPTEGSMPYENEEKIIISKRIETIKNIVANNLLESQISNLETLIHDPNIASFIPLDLFVSSSDNLKIASIDSSRFILLDMGNHELIEINTSLDKVIILASFGRGPGDIAYTKDVIYSDGTVYVAMQDRRISAFNCIESPCEYDETIMIEEISPLSITKFEDHFFAIGMRPVSGESDLKPENLNSPPIHSIDLHGELVKSFGQSYDTQGNWMLIRPLIEGEIEYDDFTESIIIAHHRFPYLVIYNSADISLSNIYQFDDFILGIQEYDYQLHMLSIVMEDHSLISAMHILGDGLLLAEIETKKNMREENYSFIWDRISDFYLINLIDNTSINIGSISYSDSEGSIQRIIITKHGIMTVKSDKLYIVQSNIQ